MIPTTFLRLANSILLLMLTGLAIAENPTNANTITICDEVIFAVGTCDDLNVLDNLYTAFPQCAGSGFGVGVFILDRDNNVVPNPIPNDVEYLCEPLQVYNVCFGDTCVSTLILELSEGPKITPVPIEVISAQNYFLDNVPRPRVEDCTRPGSSYPDHLIEYDDEFIGSCEVPRVARTWKVADQCGTVSEVTQAFDIKSKTSCNIIGPRRIPIGVETLIKSVVTPAVIPPLELNWSVIGNDFEIIGSKINPGEAFLTPINPSPSQGSVMLEVIDQFGCQNFCFRDFTSYISKSQFKPSNKESKDNPLIIEVLPHSLLINVGGQVEDQIEFQIVDLIGRIIQEGRIEQGGDSIDTENAPAGLLILRVKIGEQVITRKFINF